MATAGSDIDFSLSYPLNTENLKIGIVTAVWNSEITGALQNDAVRVLAEFNIPQEQVIVKQVPGAFELPLGADWLFKFGNCDAVLCFGCVIQGDTPHFDYVCEAATHGILEIGLRESKPCIFGVLTVNTQQQAQDRAGGRLGNKGGEAALSALNMLGLQQSLNVQNKTI